MSNDEAGWDEETLGFLEPIVSISGSDKDDDFKELVYAMVVGVYFLVLARRRNPGPEEEADVEAQKMDKKTFVEMRQTALNSLGLTNDRRHRDEVDQWIALTMEQGWAHGQEWFENIPYAGQLYGEDEEGKSYQDLDEEDAVLRGVRPPKPPTAGQGDHVSQSDHPPRGGLLPGLGTMMQDRVDWLSDDRREEYVDWKADIMARIGAAA